jgi:Predicted ATPase
MVCNDKPQVDPMDEATWRRVRSILFPVRFCDGPPDVTRKDQYGNRLEYERDYNLDEKLQRLTSAFMWVLMKFYRINQEGDPFYQWKSCARVGLGPGIREPQQVLEYTNQYRSENDSIAHFLRRVIIQCAGAFVPLSIMYDLYKFSCRSKNVVVINQNKFQEYIEYTAGWGPLANVNSCEGWRDRKIPSNLGEIAPEFKTFLERPEMQCLFTDESSVS